jgi:hypothetical protein
MFKTVVDVMEGWGLGNGRKSLRLRLALVCALAFVLGMLSASCQLFPGANDSPSYRAGRVFVFTDTLSAPAQSPQQRMVVSAVYKVAKQGAVEGVVPDEVARALLLASLEDEALSHVAFTFYKAAWASLSEQLPTGGDAAEAGKVAREFFRGVNDALALYQPDRVAE